MVAKKKGLSLGLLLSLLGIGNAIQAYRLTIENRTQEKVKYVVKYVGEVEFLKFCRSDKGELGPEKMSKVIRSGSCLVLAVQAWVGSIRAKSYTTSMGGRAGDSTFVVGKDGSKFRVTRVGYRARFKH